MGRKRILIQNLLHFLYGLIQLSAYEPRHWGEVRHRMFVSFKTTQKERVGVRMFLSFRRESLQLRGGCVWWSLSEVAHLLETFITYFAAAQAAHEGC